MASINIQEYFQKTINKLESEIVKLENNLGVEHKKSPFSKAEEQKQVQKQSVQQPQQQQQQQQQQKPQKEEQQIKQQVQEKKVVTEPAATTTEQKKPQEQKPQQQQQQKQKTEGEEQKQQQQKNQKKDNKKTEGEQQTTVKGGKGKQQAAPQVVKPVEKKIENPNDVTAEDFSRFEIRVGEILSCKTQPESEKLYYEFIDIGFEKRDIASGLQQFVKMEDMKGKVMILTNLEPRKMPGNFFSNGMVMCASNEDHTKVEIMRPDPSTPVGERVQLEGGEPIPQDKREEIIKGKKARQVIEAMLAHFKTNNNGVATFCGKNWQVSTGLVKSQTLNDAHIS